ncbi:hypothetical protein D4764_03G0009560 [Takifugu flavidus]|uniref:Uncharacterized protein n=1 Tax=Takifugu flavidus TaxID=433684 RepID=A0A5C6NAS3_9TELE|nr:hypothetical protein D4764_03G0009560 [Takifugu flavidus]
MAPFCQIKQFLVLTPDELEGVHTHTFKLKPFKKAKSCDICKQAITKEGLVCKGRKSAERLCANRVVDPALVLVLVRRGSDLQL